MVNNFLPGPSHHLVVDEGLGVVVAKALLGHFAEKVALLDKSVIKNVCEFALSRLLSRTVSFEEQVREGHWVGVVLFCGCDLI